MIGFTNAHLDPDAHYSETEDPSSDCTMCGAHSDTLTALDGEHVCADCFARDASVPAVAGNGPTPTPVYPAIARQEAVEADSAVVYQHLSETGPQRFDVAAKMEQAEAFTLRRGGSSLAIPSKLANVSLSQPAIEAIAARMEAEEASYLPCRIFVGESLGGRPEIVILAEREAGKAWTLQGIGFIQDKHAAWLAPLLTTEPNGAVTNESSPVRVYVTAVTGGTPEKPTRGVNVAIAGVADAIHRTFDRAAVEAAQEAAYERGAVAA